MRRKFNSAPDGVVAAKSMIEGHLRFLLNNTGVTNDPEVDLYIINEEAVVANNRHFTGHSRMASSMPSGSATSEAQVLQVIGYMYAYLGTKDRRYLEEAEKYFDAYIEYFYAGQPIPEEPQRYICNWLINGKEPVLSNWPVDAARPTHSGFKGVEFHFTNGFLAIPHGAPHWGQYLDIATFAFHGNLAWNSIVAEVRAYAADGVSTDWDKAGDVYDVDWIINWQGAKINSNGTVLSTGHPVEEHGHIQLKDTTLTGTFKLNYANRQPVEHGGYLIGRNQVQKDRPLHVPLLGSYRQMGNASDAEIWFLEATYLLWKVTGESKYKKVLDCTNLNIKAYLEIGATDQFFRKSTEASTPYTDGISYSYRYPSSVNTTYGRDSEGYITVSVDAPAKETMEEQTIRYRVRENSKLFVEYGGVGVNGAPVLAQVDLNVTENREGAPTNKWRVNLPTSRSMEVIPHRLNMSEFTSLESDQGEDPILATADALAVYDGGQFYTEREERVLGNRQGVVGVLSYPVKGAGGIIGFWTQPVSQINVRTITVRTDAVYHIRVTDSHGWRWHWVIPNTRDQWRIVELGEENLVLNAWQPNEEADPEIERPTTPPSIGPLGQLNIILANANDYGREFRYFCINELPPTYEFPDAYVELFSLTFTCTEPFNVKVGDCKFEEVRDDAFAYTPGIIPFSNINDEDSTEFAAWRGLPYPGYQYPWAYTILNNPDDDRYLDNCVNFLYDAQQWYYQEIGVLGPVASAYIWDRWDNRVYGDADTFTMYHWGDRKAWSGYQPRAYLAGAKALHELVVQGRQPPPKLVEYVQNWSTWLKNFVMENGGRTPSDYPTAGPPIAPLHGFQGDMCGLYLAGACFSAMSGYAVEGQEALIEACLSELRDNYVVEKGASEVMSGGWSPALRGGTNSMFYGFWTGEILRGLGAYLLYKKTKPGEDILRKARYHGVVDGNTKQQEE